MSLLIKVHYSPSNIMYLHTQTCRLRDLPSIAVIHIKVHGSIMASSGLKTPSHVGFDEGSFIAMLDDLEWTSVWWGQWWAYVVFAHKHMSDHRLFQVMDAGANRLAAQRVAWSSACGSRGGESKNSLKLRTVGHELLQLLMCRILHVA